MQSDEPLRRGDIVTVAGGTSEFGRKPRPAVLLQSPDLFGEGVPLPICPITSVPVSAPLLRIPLAQGPETGLERPSWAAIDAVQTIRRRRIDQQIGRLDAAAMLAIGRALIVFFGVE
jgi:mRNA interferase MazF